MIDAWQRFVAGEQDVAMDPRILASWQRSRAAGVVSDTPSFRETDDRDLQRRLAISTGLVGAVAPHLGWLSRTLATIDHATCIVDEDGIVLWSTGSAALLDRLHMHRGFDWSERRMGTNGAGTAIATASSIAIRDGQHYCRAWHDLTGLGVSLVDPDGDRRGAIGLVTQMGDSDRERLLAMEHIGHALERELALVHAEARSRRLRVRAERMRDAIAALSRALSPDQIVDSVLDHGLPALRASCGGVWLASGGNELRLAGSRDSVWRTHHGVAPISARLGFAEAFRTGKLVVVESPEELARIGGDLHPALREIGARAFVPLRIDARMIGVLAIGVPDWRTFDDDDRVLMHELGDHCAHALERASLYTSEQAARATAERATAARDELLGLVSHHLRSPLALVATSSEILTSLVGADAPGDAILQHASQIGDAARRMSSLVRNLLEAGRLDAGSLRVELRNVPVADVLAQIVRSLEPTLDLRGHRIELSVEEPLVTVCDPELATIAMTNLVENAVKFSPPGDTIVLRVRREGDRAHVCVIDSGPGIAPHELPRVFERYYQATG
ncbi:MAG: GAF domain-containing protein, partial [Kofleriaceae bacterium]